MPPVEEPTDDQFVTRTARRSVSRAQLFVGLFALAAAGTAVVNLVWLTFAADRGERLLWVVAMSAMAILAVIAYGRLRSYESIELVINRSGVRIVNKRGTRSFPWPEITGLGVVSSGGMAGRALAIESTTSAKAARRLGRLVDVNWMITRALPLATIVQLGQLEAEEREVLTAIQHYSGGHFPGQERRLFDAKRPDR